MHRLFVTFLCGTTTVHPTSHTSGTGPASPVVFGPLTPTRRARGRRSHGVSEEVFPGGQAHRTKTRTESQHLEASEVHVVNPVEPTAELTITTKTRPLANLTHHSPIVTRVTTSPVSQSRRVEKPREDTKSAPKAIFNSFCSLRYFANVVCDTS